MSTATTTLRDTLNSLLAVVTIESQYNEVTRAHARIKAMRDASAGT